MVEQAVVHWREAGTPVSQKFDDPYFSLDSGIAETEYVFLKANNLHERFKERSYFTIGETGFGTGLNFLCAWRLRDRSNPACHLHFVSFEKYPLAQADLIKALKRWSELQPYSKLLLKHYPMATPGWHRISFFAAKVELSLYIGDAQRGLADYSSANHFMGKRINRDGCGEIDAWFLDGFAPAKNPDMWTHGIANAIARLSTEAGTFSTFTAASAVRSHFTSAGFDVNKTKGFGKKRHMLSGRLSRAPGEEPETLLKPWFARTPTKTKSKEAVVIGAGLAGCSAAFSLARRGWHVSLVERHTGVAGEASGNPQGVLYAKLSAEPSARSDFYTAGYQYSLNTLRQVCQVGPDSDWNRTGVLQLANDPEELARQQRFLAGNPQPSELVHAVTPEEASALAGSTLHTSGLYFPAAGWVRPLAFCKRLSEHSGINLMTRARVGSIARHGDTWLVKHQDGSTIAQAPVVIIATAQAALDLEATEHLPLKSIRGQVSQLPAPSDIDVNTVICADSYVCPPINNQLHIGATFDLTSQDTHCRTIDHLKNLNATGALVPDLGDHIRVCSEDIALVKGRVGFRCSTPDYMPVVGPVADFDGFIHRFARLRKDATTRFLETGVFHPGLFVSVGHGSKGLTSCPLAGELLANYICNQPMPIENRLLEAVHPARFIVRDLIRNRI